MTYFSVRMRANTQGRHISGAERIVGAEHVAETCAQLAQRALDHPKGEAAQTHLTVEALDAAAITHADALRVDVAECPDPDAARAVIHGLLAPLTPHADALIRETFAARDMRGAMLVCAGTGARLEPDCERGVRVSHMDALEYVHATGKDAAREALVLSSKVAAHPDVIAELCISDDPEYTTGYVAHGGTYTRIPHIKPKGSPAGARAFLVREGADIPALIDYLERQPVLIQTEVLA
ncbi:6-carboxyhexanoate--CoA ligase [Corynebacterium sp. HMSC074A01]|uniref:6-carboxyhexanoate--CoA ligase n=1 Tax=Corynebacterium sp. HMSC074A01 TaxID=1715030 RepID=UPI0008A45A32|nr:6-carboxyhexanoate--CoA ligase [Corynebacterium sp. HMSC074A01]OHF36766.1 6-carboxyhexanoate--CoA ligase [Corynebacterium sp. HMSC074A01]